MRLTTKQKELLAHIIEANLDGTALDLNQLMGRASYSPTKQAINFSIRFMINKGLIEKGGMEKRRGRSRLIIVPTPLGIHTAKGVTPLFSKSYIMSEQDAALLSDIESI